MYFFILLVASVCFGQTKIEETQINKPAVKEDSVLIQSLDGKLNRVVLGPGLTLNKTVTPWRLEAAVGTGGGGGATVTNLFFTPLRLTATTGTSWTWTTAGLSAVNIMFVTRNGILQWPGADYTVTGTTLTFTTGQTSAATDTVIVQFYSTFKPAV